MTVSYWCFDFGFCALTTFLSPSSLNPLLPCTLIPIQFLLSVDSRPQLHYLFWSPTLLMLSIKISRTVTLIDSMSAAFPFPDDLGLSLFQLHCSQPRSLRSYPIHSNNYSATLRPSKSIPGQYETRNTFIPILVHETALISF